MERSQTTMSLELHTKTIEDEDQTLDFDDETLDQEEANFTKESETIDSLNAKMNEETKKIDELEEKMNNIKYVFDRTLKATKLDHKKEITELKETIHSVVNKTIEGTEFKFTLGRILNTNEVIKKIESWIAILYCDYDGCSEKAEFLYDKPDLCRIYCSAHVLQFEHKTKALNFKSEIIIIKSLLNELERKFALVQVKMAFATNESAINICTSSYQEKQKELTKSYKKLTKSLDKMLERIDAKINTSNLKTKTKRNSKYESLSFINDDCEKMNELCIEIIAKISTINLNEDCQDLIRTMANKIQDSQSNEEEEKFKSYENVPDEIYDKEFVLFHIPYKTKSCIQNIEQKIEKCMKKVKTKQKNEQQLLASINSVHHILKEKLNEYEDQLKTMNEQKENLAIKIDKLEKRKENRIKGNKFKKMCRNLILKEVKYYKDKFHNKSKESSCKDKRFTKSSMAYNQQNSYFKSTHFIKNNENYKLVDFTRKITELVDFDTKKKWVYKGQIDSKTKKRDGIGILVENCGTIYEGFWKNGKMNGCGRTIFSDGSYYIGDYKDDNWCEGGIKYNEDGTEKWKVNSDNNQFVG